MTLTFSGARLIDGRIVDVTVSGGTITAVTPAGELPTVGEHVELDGHVLIPGLWDRHTHFAQWAQSARRVQLGDAGSAADAAAVLAAHAETHPDGDLVGVGFRDALWPDAPHFALLDEALGDDADPERRVVAVSADLHTVWLNSAALKAHGFYEHPSGVLREQDAFAVIDALDDVPEATVDGWAHEAAEAAAARGVVGIVDFELGFAPDAWRRRFAAGFDELRVEAAFYPERLADVLALGLGGGAQLDASGLLTLGPLKVITDGSLNTRTAYLREPYASDVGADERGLLTVPPDELIELLRQAVRADLQAAVHAIGDRAVSHALDAFALAGARGSVEHAQLVHPEDLSRFAELGVTASVQPEHAMDDRDVAERYWGARSRRAFPLRSLLESGATLAFGSDAPVAPLDPWLAIASAVFRTRGDRAAWHAEQCVTVQQAVQASVRSSIAVGQPADLVVLGADPLGAEVAELRSQPVVATMVAGRFSYDAIR
ncbi:amidohydrolase [Gryllotalpicola protaetiae]|uniref:Amidohydrolase n=1 Tax=Gryllotalpicola protaetiae TaxID=2419771 RepID=A0A387BLU8_9MICO|nr:amidohydrolase [Gryllotalpicola protaetiae]AYG05145.1 amidohydrolase [Gryllotalpicola protaetiae]